MRRQSLPCGTWRAEPNACATRGKQQGFPISSGVIEGLNKSVIAARTCAYENSRLNNLSRFTMRNNFKETVPKTVIRRGFSLALLGGVVAFIIALLLERAKRVGERLRETIEAHTFVKPRNVPISVGVAEFTAGDTLEQLIKRADKAPYQAKEQG